jgi:hypothetical protein
MRVGSANLVTKVTSKANIEQPEEENRDSNYHPQQLAAQYMLKRKTLDDIDDQKGQFIDEIV